KRSPKAPCIHPWWPFLCNRSRIINCLPFLEENKDKARGRTDSCFSSARQQRRSTVCG
ncbi:unnamed protein product, partial [Candidula unifasciata]